MENKITNFDVATEKLCLEQTAELPIETDFFVPDYLSDIKKVLKCKITPFITSKQISGNALTIEGLAAVTVIFADTDGLVSSAEEEVPFKKTFETNNVIDDGNCEINVNATCHNCRAITERKLSVKGSVRLDALVFMIEKEQIVCDVDSEYFELLRGEAPATTPLGISTKSLIIEEDLALPTNLPSIAHIIRNDSVATVTDCKIISNKIIIKGNLRIISLYCSTENTVKKHSFDIPYNQIIDMVGIEEGCECEPSAEICNINISTKTAEDGTCRSLMLTAKLLITAKAQCNSNVAIILDAYSNKYTSTLNKKDITFNKIVNQINESFLCKKKINLPEGCSDKIIDLWCQKNNCSARFEGNTTRVMGGITICVITQDENGELIYLERIIDFEYPIEAKTDLDGCRCSPKIQIENSDFTVLNKNEVELKIELTIKAAVYVGKTISLIKSIDIDESSPLSSDSASLIAYYADKGENIWEICKSFLANRSELIEINHLSSDTVENAKMLLIPRM